MFSVHQIKRKEHINKVAKIWPSLFSVIQDHLTGIVKRQLETTTRVENCLFGDIEDVFGWFLELPNGRIVALCTVRKLWRGSEFEIAYIYVCPKYRRQGIGQRFVEFVCAKCLRKYNLVQATILVEALSEHGDPKDQERIEQFWYDMDFESLELPKRSKGTLYQKNIESLAEYYSN